MRRPLGPESKQGNTMTTTTFAVLAVRTPAMPRGARVAAKLFSSALNWLASAPAAPTLSRGEEAAPVRRMAYELQRTDPGFAADLYAAAARHESLAD